MYILNLTLTLNSKSIFSSFQTRTKSPIRSIVPPNSKHMANFVPKATADGDRSKLTLDRRDLLLVGAGSLCGAASPSAANSTADYPIKLDGAVSRVVARPKKSRSKKEKEDEEEVLVIDGIEFDRNLAVKFDVYVNDEDAAALGGPDKAEFAGSLVNVPHGQGRGKSKTTRTCLRLGISDLLEDVGADDDESVVVTLVPKSGKGLVTIGNIGIELQA
ncbi:Polyphenol oxidase, C-terminal [Parasponia andersonii]|uniref:Polyphenol oxidase, C-terminal n=1 Tax=Parasponia andersonii TaxID=3476 RepID=A0A2P5BY40_PARAD|nr:Polyphenol oxidase, C-terminal [Parasponia andersonii]